MIKQTKIIRSLRWFIIPVASCIVIMGIPRGAQASPECLTDRTQHSPNSTCTLVAQATPPPGTTIPPSSAEESPPASGPTELEPINTGDAEGTNTCGQDSVAVKTSFNFGCRGSGNAIVDLLFALFRFLSVGVGIIAIGSLIVAGIQYSASQGDPNITKASIKRATNTLLALVLYFLIYAIIEWIVPGGLFN